MQMDWRHKVARARLRMAAARAPAARARLRMVVATRGWLCTVPARAPVRREQYVGIRWRLRGLRDT